MAAMKKIFMVLLGLLAVPAMAWPLLIAAASDLTYSIDDLAAAFRQQAPEAEIKISLGASGNFYAQIKNGAPFEVFLSADMDYPARLAREGAADPATLTPYAVGRLALWSLDPRFDLAQGMAVLRDPRLTRIAIANPDFAPYGRAAKAALEQQHLWEALKPKLVFGDNIAQTVQFIQTGNAQLGIVSLATLYAPRLHGVGSYYPIPEGGRAPIEQGAIVTNRGKANPLAARFVQFLGSATGRALLLRHGYGLPPAQAASRHD
jgi:molybdate transport system substrate-binding protein